MMKIFFLVLLFLWNDKEGADAEQECGSVVNNTLKSPGYPNKYPSDMDCNYTISIPNNMTVITFIDFELEDQTSCNYDYLEIVKDARIVGKYCDRNTGLRISLTEGQVLIKFHTDGSQERRGFLMYINIDPNGMSFDQVWKSTWINQNYQWCGPVINNTITSPGYPNDYSNNTDCIFSVPIPQGMVINITINELHLEDSASCDRDYLQITNENRVFGKYCGHMTGKTVFVSGKYALITFHSGSKIQNRGFLIKFSDVVPSSVPEPVAFYPLNARYKTAEKDNRLLKGILGNVVLTNGPYNEPGGAYVFYGTRSSYIEFPNIGALDTRLSITLMCWVNVQQLEREQYLGPLFMYGNNYDPMFNIVGMGIWTGKLFFSIDPRLPSTLTVEVLPVGKWVHVAGSYDYTTGNCSLYINGHLSISENTGTGYKIDTTAKKVRMGAIVGRLHHVWKTYFKGKIAEMKVYDVALNEAQIQTSIRRVPPMVTFPAAVLAIQGGMLSCSARGTTPIYTALIWNSTVLVNTTNTATIPRLDKDGSYTCQATNQYGTNVKELQVNFTTIDPEIGFLISEGYPCCYPKNTDNSSTYPIPDGWSMNIYFQDFDVEDSKHCM